MLVLRPSIASLLVVAAVAEAANLRQGQRKLQTYTSSDDYFSLMLDRVNQARASEGLPALCTNKKLQAAAQRHSDDQAANDYMDHTGTDGSNIEQRIAGEGFDWSAVAENVAAGQPDVDAVMEAWMASPGHRENILGDYTMLGTAYAYNPDTTYQHYWTQDFGTGDAEECEGGDVAIDADTIATSIESTEAAQTQGDHVKYNSKTYTKQGETEDSCSGSEEKDTEAPCTDAPIVVVDPPPTTETPYEDSKTEASCSGSHENETEGPYTDTPIVVVDPPVYEGSKTEESCSGSQEKETEAPCTDTPIVVVDPPVYEDSKTEASCSGSHENETEGPYTDTPIVVVDPPVYEGSKTEESCSGSQEKETEAPCTDTPIVVVDPPVYEGSNTVDSCSGSQENETEAPCTDAPIVVVDPPPSDYPSQETDAPVVVVDPPIDTITEGTKQTTPYTEAPTTELPEGTPAAKVDSPDVDLLRRRRYDLAAANDKDDCTPGW